MERGENKFRAISTIDIVQVALIAAITFAVTYVIQIPVGTKGVLHLGDAIAFTGAILLGKKKGALAAAIGMTLFDITTPYIIWAPFTFVVKGLMAYIAGAIAYRNGYNGDKLINNIFAFIVGGICMIAGYYLAGGIIYGSLVTAIGDIPGNILQISVGIILALPLVKALKNVRRR